MNCSASLWGSLDTITESDSELDTLELILAVSADLPELTDDRLLPVKKKHVPVIRALKENYEPSNLKL